MTAVLVGVLTVMVTAGPVDRDAGSLELAAHSVPVSIPKAGCTSAAGFKQVCINVRGAGLRVDQVTGELERLGRMVHYDCGGEINAFGTLATGAAYSQTGTAQCGTNAAWVDFYPRSDFQAGSNICVRARMEGKWSRPACLTIKP